MKLKFNIPFESFCPLLSLSFLYMKAKCEKACIASCLGLLLLTKNLVSNYVHIQSIPVCIIHILYVIYIYYIYIGVMYYWMCVCVGEKEKNSWNLLFRTPGPLVTTATAKAT